MSFIAATNFSVGARKFRTGQLVSGCEVSPTLTAVLLNAGRIEERPAEQSPTHYQDADDQLQPIVPGQTVQRAWSPKPKENADRRPSILRPDRAAAVAELVAAFKRNAARRGKRTARGTAHLEGSPVALLLKAGEQIRRAKGGRVR
jgi:hypothetical protein